MPRIKYESKKLGPEKLKQIQQANEIIAEYEAHGIDLTLRQLYYQYVARGLIPNNDKEYKKLGDAVADGRLAGLIDWDKINDLTRQVKVNSHWKNPESIVSICAETFAIDKWDDQPTYVEVYVEKDALLSVISGPCEELDVPYLACRGYASASCIWGSAYRRIRPKVLKDKSVTILYLGDHDPSGIDMTRDVRERINLFCGNIPFKVEIKRIALNMDQVELYDPPPNPTKMKDTRADDYVANFGHECWELDALDPIVIRDLITAEVEALRDQDLWDAAVSREQKGRDQLARISNNWDQVTAFLEDLTGE